MKAFCCIALFLLLLVVGLVGYKMLFVGETMRGVFPTRVFRNEGEVVHA